ncbi:MAG TPA: substrate-binding domain-containing protein [Streptosporangiaceae bacterium]|jgi:ABC-type phosphate transport system substrate-binding protein
MTSRTRPSRRLDVLRRLLAFRRSAIGRLIAASAAVVLGAGPLMAATTSSTEVLAQINGSGSTWAQPAIEQWINDTTAQGLQVSFNGQGSAQGRTDFRNDTTDFGVSDIGFQGFNPQDGSNDSACQNPPNGNCRAFAYLPIVAGGTAFPYQIRVGGNLVENLRLSGETIAKIFTNQIRNWDDPEITRDNNGHRLPDLPIIPVMDSEGSGASFQFSAYLGREFPSIWKPFNQGSDAATEFFPRQGSAIAEAGSDGIMNFITSAAGNGAIGYDQYSYPKGENCPGCTSGWPVALLQNKAGFFVAPTQYNVAVALTKAVINMNKSSPNYLLQTLNNVYTDPDKRAYALSSYSYMIIPTGANDPTMSQGKRQTLANYIDWAICGGQAEIGPTGYSPLPVNLAQASFAQMDKLHAADHAVQISNLNVAKQCHNPTFFAGHPDGNLLAQIAPPPPSCDKAGVGPCPGETGVTSTGNPLKGKAPPPAARAPGSGSKTKAGHHGKVLVGAAVSVSASASAAAAPGSANDTAADSKTIPSAQDAGEGVALAVIAGLGALLLIAIPAVVAGRRQQRRAVR